MHHSADVVICGAGIAGISAAYHLAAGLVNQDIVLVDHRSPLSLTSDKSTECYRNWWPSEPMVRLMNRSIDILERMARDTGNVFHLNRRGYLYVTGDPTSVERIRRSAEKVSRLGAGPLRVHESEASSTYEPNRPGGFSGSPDGADLILDQEILFRNFPSLTTDAVAALHIRKAGWLSAQQYGSHLLSIARSKGVQLLKDRCTGVTIRGGRVGSILLESGDVIDTPNFVIAAGPFLSQVAGFLGVELPVTNEVHLKAAIRDTHRVVPRDAPLLIWTDPQYLPWSEQEEKLLAEDEETLWLLEEFPPGAHTRPEGPRDSPITLMLWEYQVKEIEAEFPVPLDPVYPEIVLRGLSTMLPGFHRYFGKVSRPILDGGYYTRTPENFPIIGPLPVDGAYVIGALSGFGIMVSSGAGELLASYLGGLELPEYAPAFHLDRYQDPKYMGAIQSLDFTGQL